MVLANHFERTIIIVCNNYAHLSWPTNNMDHAMLFMHYKSHECLGSKTIMMLDPSLAHNKLAKLHALTHTVLCGILSVCCLFLICSVFILDASNASSFECTKPCQLNAHRFHLSSHLSTHNSSGMWIQTRNQIPRQQQTRPTEQDRSP